jgi:hypothetical protein
MYFKKFRLNPFNHDDLSSVSKIIIKPLTGIRAQAYGGQLVNKLHDQQYQKLLTGPQTKQHSSF